MSKRVFKAEYEQEFRGIKKSRKGNDWFYCESCQVDLILKDSGITAIKNHVHSKKHKESKNAASTSRSISNFMPCQTAPTVVDNQVCIIALLLLILLFSHSLLLGCGGGRMLRLPCCAAFAVFFIN